MSCPIGLGGIALNSMLARDGQAARIETSLVNPLAAKRPPLIPKAKRVIYLHMSGGPPQQDLFDYKPKLVELHMQPCPDELLKNQRFAFIKGHPKMLGSPHKFRQHGHSGAWVSELLPLFSACVDEVAFVKSM